MSPTAHDPVLPAAQMHLVMPNAPVTGTVVGSRRCTKGKSASFVRHVEIDVSGTPLAGNFQSGQSFGVIPPGTDARGRPHKVRLYSVASPSWGEDGEGRVVSTTPKRLIDETLSEGGESHSLFLGVCSNYLCDLGPGAKVQLSGPAGKRFLLPQDRSAHDYLFLATGTGIAPFRGMLMELLSGPPEGSPARAGWHGPSASGIHLVMGVAYRTDLLYDEFLSDLAARHANFHYHRVISRERPEATGHGPYVHDLLAARADVFEPLLRSPRTLIYACGLTGMQTGLFRLIGRLGLAADYLHLQESISGADPTAWTDDDLRRRVHAGRRCMLEVY